jgi:RHS repeat-associated protein
MKRSFLVPIFAAACSLAPMQAQTPPPDSNDPQISSNTNPPPDDVPDIVDCLKCGKVVGTADKSKGESCPSGTTEQKHNSSVDYTFGVGTTSYSSKNNFVARDLGKRSLKFTSYNPPRLDPPPISSSLSSEWREKLVRPVVVGLVTEEITNATFTPAALQLYANNAGNAYVKKDTSGNLRQILSDQYLTDITVPGGTVLIKSYIRSTIGSLDSSTGLYAIPGTARLFRSIQISRPTATGLDTVDILTSDYSSSETLPKVRGARWVKSGAAPNLTWTFSEHTGQPSDQNKYSVDTLAKQDLGNGLIQRTRTIQTIGSSNELITTSSTGDKYRDLGGGNLRIFETVEAPGTPEELITSYTYTDATGTGTVGLNGFVTNPTPGASLNNLVGSRLHSMQRSDGYWEEYKYQYNAGTKIMLTEKWSTWKDSAVGDKANSRYTTIVLEEGSRTVIQKIGGQIVSNEHETLTLAFDGTRTLRNEVKTGTTTAPLITENSYFSDSATEPNKGRIQYTRHPDGTLTRYTYQTASGGLKTIVEKGAAGADQFAPSATGPVPALTEGTRTEKVTNSFEKVIDSKTYDIASNLLLEQSTATSVDAVGRPTHIIYDADPNDYEEFTFACCGVKTQRARDGALTEYAKDALDRPTLTTVTLGPKTTSTGYTYATENLAGRALPKTAVTRMVAAGGNSTGSLLVSETVSDLRGQPLVSRSPDANGDNIPETFTYTHNSATRTESSTGPDGVTRTRTTYTDGKSHTSVSTFDGSAITPLITYDYAPHNLNGGGIRTTAELSAENSTLKTEKSFVDIGNRTFRTESPGYSGAVLILAINFDVRGRAVCMSSTGKPATKRVLNLLGQVTESWTDSNADGQFNNTAVNAMKDSMNKTSIDFVTEDGVVCQRTRQWVRNDADSEVLLSTTFRSLDGLYSKSVQLSSPVTITTRTKPLDGNTVTETRSYLSATGFLAQSSTITLDADGTTAAVRVNKDIAGAPVTTVTQVSDLLGRLMSVHDGRKPATTYSEFTSTGTPLKTTNSDGTYAVTTLNNAARPIKEETYDAHSALIATVNTIYHPDGNVAANWGTNINPTYKSYDLQGNLVEVRTYRSSNLALVPEEATPNYDATTWAYEPATGLLSRKQYDDGKGIDYTYTTDGKLLTRTWARGIVTTYGYTPSGKLTSTDYSDATPDVSITYDRLGRQLALSNGVAQSFFAYDPATLVLNTETIRYDLDLNGIFEFTRVLDRSRDTVGRDTGWQLKDGSTIENEAAYAYSPLDGRLSQVSIPQSESQVFTYTYLAHSTLIEKVAGPVHDVFNTWEANRDELASKQNKVGTDVISQHDYTVNALGQRTNVSQVGTAFQAVRGVTWGYDSLGQVTSADSSINSDDRAYEYDAIGNRIEAQDGVIGVTGTPNYAVNALNQYTSVPPGSLAPSYDLDGNITAGPLPVAPLTNSALACDAENRLVSTTVGSTATTYFYDAQSRRIAKTIGSDSTIYVYDSWNVIAEWSADVQSVFLARTYLWGIDLSGSMQGAGGVGGLLALQIHHPKSAIYYPTYDGNGNVSEYLDETGVLAGHFEYDPFGKAVVELDTEGIFSYRFSTKPIDVATGLYYYGYRYYDPVSGRWPSRDPIEEKGGVNLYGFWKNDTINGWDVLGLYIIPPPPKKPPSPGTAIADALIAFAIAYLADAMKFCDGECKKAQDCVNCCNRAAGAAHIALGVQTIKANLTCLKYVNPVAMAACAALIDLAHLKAVKEITKAQNECNDSCMDNP